LAAKRRLSRRVVLPDMYGPTMAATRGADWGFGTGYLLGLA